MSAGPITLEQAGKIQQALDRGDLITKDLQVVQKHGWQWRWIQIKNAFLSLVKNDPWQKFRLDAVARAFVEATKDLSDKSIIGHILSAFAQKAEKSTNQTYKMAISTLIPSQPASLVTELSLGDVQQKLYAFGQKLYMGIISRNPNSSQAISPLSIMVALGMLLRLIRPDQKEKFIAALGFQTKDEASIHHAISSLVKMIALPKSFKDGSLESAQALAIKKSEMQMVNSSLPEFLQKTYQAELINDQDLHTAVNQWVSKKTRGKIPTLLNDNSSDMVLLNAVYLNFKWEEAFEKPEKGWSVEEFTATDGSRHQVSMMDNYGSYKVYSGEDFDMIILPYRSPQERHLAQVIFLPKDPSKLNQLEDKLKPEMIAHCLGGAKFERSVDLRLPKIEAESQVSLMEILNGMGFPIEAIDPQMANMSVSDVIHKTFVSNDETGTEAAAVTGIILESCMAPNYNKEVKFHVRHAYTYLIMDGDTVLFQGRVADGAPLVVDKD